MGNELDTLPPAVSFLAGAYQGADGLSQIENGQQESGALQASRGAANMIGSFFGAPGRLLGATYSLATTFGEGLDNASADGRMGYGPDGQAMTYSRHGAESGYELAQELGGGTAAEVAGGVAAPMQAIGNLLTAGAADDVGGSLGDLLFDLFGGYADEEPTPERHSQAPPRLSSRPTHGIQGGDVLLPNGQVLRQ